MHPPVQIQNSSIHCQSLADFQQTPLHQLRLSKFSLNASTFQDKYKWSPQRTDTKVVVQHKMELKSKATQQQLFSFFRTGVDVFNLMSVCVCSHYTLLILGKNTCAPRESTSGILVVLIM